MEPVVEVVAFGRSEGKVGYWFSLVSGGELYGALSVWVTR